MLTLQNARTQIEDISLTDSYRDKKFTKNFDKHINSLIDTSILLSSSQDSLLSNDVQITDQLYWESEANILEKLDDVEDPDIISQLSDLEDFLYSKIIRSLGRSYDNSSPLNLIIDNSVHNVLMSVKFNYFSKSSDYFNPWKNAEKILLDNQVLFTFSSDADKLNSMGFNVDVNLNDSEDISDKMINVIGKGSRAGYSYGYVRDLLALKNTVLNILEDRNSYGEGRATKAIQIIRILREMGIHDSELSDGNIRNWLIGPLKRSSKIGSNKEGYFLLKTCDDVAISYDSHLENLKGYFRTLENHRRLAMKLNCSSEIFEQHLNFLNNNSTF